MKIKVSKSKPQKVKTKLLVLTKKDKKEKLDFVKKDFSAERTVEITVKNYDLKNLRKIGFKAVKIADDLKLSELSVVFPNIKNQKESAQALAEGLILKSYKFNKFKTKDKNNEIKQIEIITEKNKLEIKKGVEKGKIVSEGVFIARDFVNDPSNHRTPKTFAEKIVKISEKNNLKTKIYDEKEMKNKGMGCLLGVARGSKKEPKLVVVEYNGNKKNNDFYALIGKGITFDSGGISLKPAQKMYEMKGDMAGGAVVIGTINSIAKLKVPINLIAIVPCVENMPGGNAMKPGDILLSMSGKTVEVMNTDAEGRLILADALHFAVNKNPKAIIDLATLTGSCISALGYETAALVSTNKKLAKNISKAAEKTNEKVWQLPLNKEYTKAIKSDIADIKNQGYDNGAAGTLTAAAFLKEFVNNKSWAHIDIAGTYWARKEKKFNKKGATGWGVRLLIEFFNKLSN